MLIFFVQNAVPIMASIAAAGFWFAASRVRIPPFAESSIDEAFTPFQKAAKLNSYAAISAGISALTQLSNYLPL